MLFIAKYFRYNHAKITRKLILKVTKESHDAIFDLRSLIFTRRHLCEISNVRQERGRGWCIGKLKSGIHIRGEDDEFHFRWHVENSWSQLSAGREKNVIVKKEVRSYFWSRHRSHSCALCLSLPLPFFFVLGLSTRSTTVLFRIFLPQLFV